MPLRQGKLQMVYEDLRSETSTLQAMLLLYQQYNFFPEPVMQTPGPPISLQISC